MKRKIIALIDQNPAIQNLIAEIKAIDDQADEEVSFLKKKAEQVANRCKERKDPIWDRLAMVLKEKKLLPDNFNNDDLGCSLSENTIYYRLQESSEKREGGIVTMGNISDLPPEIKEIMLQELNKE